MHNITCQVTDVEVHRGEQKAMGVSDLLSQYYSVFNGHGQYHKYFWVMAVASQ